MSLSEIQTRLRSLGSPEAAAFAARFFKTGPGDYAEGDLFLGIRVPLIRKLVREFRDLPLAETAKLLQSQVHEDRLLALLILVGGAQRGTPETRERIYNLYLEHSQYINNWDLVDVSCRQIVGGYLLDKDRSVLDELARSEMLWERRIGIVSTQHFHREGDLDDSLRIARILHHDRHDLIRKAVGWTLREVGKKNPQTLERYLLEHAGTMPRTMLRYAIERFDGPTRKHYMNMRLNT